MLAMADSASRINGDLASVVDGACLFFLFPFFFSLSLAFACASPSATPIS